MSDRTQDLKNLRAVATACKNYTDKKAEEILWQVGEYSISTSDDNTTASSKTVPSGATRCKIKRVYGNTVKNNPTVASNTDSYSVKTMPTTVYDFDVSKVDGASEKSENLTNVDELYVNNTRKYWCSIPNLETGTYTFHIRNTSENNKTVVILGYMDNSYVRDVKTNISVSANSDTLVSVNINDVSDINGFGIYSSGNTTYSELMVAKGTLTEYKPYYSGIHNFAWNGVKVEGANLIGNYERGTYIDTSVNSRISYCFGSQVQTLTFKSFVSNYQYIIQRFIKGTRTIIDNVTSWSNSNQTITTNGIDDYVILVRDSSNPSASLPPTTAVNIMAVRGSTAPTSFVPYIIPTTIPIDLSTITYNDSPLFEENSLKGVGTAKDYITPYKAHKQMKYVDLGSYDWSYTSGDYPRFYTEQIEDINTSSGNYLCDKYTYVSEGTITGDNIDMTFTIRSNGRIMVKNLSYTDPTAFKTAMSGVYLVYELATPIEVSIDWSSTLRGIQGYSNGTISLLNTNNQDTANTITYNSTIMENCCAKIVQSRGGSVVKTINLPTQASDGYSAGSVANVRDFTTNKRGTNVSKNSDLGTLNWTYNNNNTFYATLSGNKKVANNVVANLLCALYTSATYNNVYFRNNDKIISSDSNYSQVWAYDTTYTDATTFTTAMSGIYIYYELADASKTSTDITAIENIIEVEPNDVFTFYDSNDNEVAVPSDLTYRIEVAN